MQTIILADYNIGYSFPDALGIGDGYGSPYVILTRIASSHFIHVLT